MAGISKAEYLKRYMSGVENDEKKKKKRKIVKTGSKHARSKIIDDDIDVKSLIPSNTELTIEEELGEDDPTIAAIIDERPDNIKQLESYRHSDGRWKTLANEDKFDSSLLKTLTEEEIIKNKKSLFKGELNQNLSEKEHSVRKTAKGDNSFSRRRRHDSDSDTQHTEQKQYKNKSRKRHDSSSDDTSPPRRVRHDSSPDSSPRRKRHDSEPGRSPPRRMRHDSESDESPPRRNRHDSDSDKSPPRRRRQNSDSDKSPPRRRRQNSDSDKSPPRRRRQNSDSDESPPRRKGQNFDSDESPPRRKRQDSDSDESPLRRKRQSSDSEESPPRRRRPDDKTRPDQSSGKEKDKMTKTLSGKKAGLSSAKDMKLEAEKIKRKEDEAFKKIGDEALGRNATTVFRDRKTGKRRNLDEEAEEDRAKLEKERKMAEKYDKWGKGLKQQEQQQKNVEDHMYEMSKPLARSKDDEDLDKQLKEMERADDPMLKFIKKKKSKEKTKTKELPRYKGPAPPPNRFNIMPGYRWDGVDRSNGFESKYFSSISNKKAVSADAYKWSVEDM